MQATISKWGNSQGIRLSKDLLAAVHIGINEKVEVKTEGEKIIIEKVKAITMESLFENYSDDDYVPEEINWGEKQGKELW